jgi:hypothetical protein
VTFLEALATNRPMRRRSWWKRDPAGPGDRWLAMTIDGGWTWRDGSPAAEPQRPEYLCDDWEVAATESDRLALYFGYGAGGHFLRGPRLDSLDPEHDYPGFPWTAALLDTGLLKNGKVPDEPDGRVWWTCGGTPDLWHAFYWWDRSGDKRAACNSGFYVRGFAFEEREAAFAYACECWPKIVARQIHPLVLQPRRAYVVGALR